MSATAGRTAAAPVAGAPSETVTATAVARPRETASWRAVANIDAFLSVAGRSAGDPSLCDPASRRVCPCRRSAPGRHRFLGGGLHPSYRPTPVVDGWGM